MPVWLLPLLTNPRAWAALGLSLLIGALGVQTWRIDSLKRDHAADQSEIRVLNSDIAAQNKAVEGLATAAAAVTSADAARVDKAVSAVQAAGATLSKRIAQIEATKSPAKGVCQDAAALALIKGSVQ